VVAIRRAIERDLFPAVSVDYDRHSDVLYIALEPIQPAEGEDFPRGIVKRFSMEDGSPVGVTVVGFKRNAWDRDVLLLAAIATAHLLRSPSESENLLRQIQDAVRR
jgi:hypothetical protein